MQKFGILGAKQGDRKDFPVMLINNAFTAESANVQIWDGEVRSDKMRGREIVSEGFGLVGHWKMNDDADQTVVVDSSDSGNNGTSVNNIVSAVGKINEAITFNGIDDYIDLNDTFQSTLRDSFSMSAWIKFTDGIAGTQDYFSVVDTTGPDSFVILRSELGRIKFLYKSEDAEGNLAGTLKVVLDDGPETWHHIVCVADSTINGIGGKKIYLDGELMDLDATEDGSTLDVDFSLFSSALTGKIGQKDGTVPGNFFTGDIDDFRIYNRALTPWDVSRIYNNSNGTEEKITPQVPTPDGNQVIEYFNHQVFTGVTYTEYLLAFTKSNIYYWSSGSEIWVSLTPTTAVLPTGITECTTWSIDTLNDGVVATNGIDIPLWWDGSTGVPFVNLGKDATQTNGPEISAGLYISRARSLIVHENYILLFNISTDDSVNYPNVMQWCNHRDENDWSGGDSGSTPVPGRGEIYGAGVKGDLLYVFKDSSTRKYWLTEQATVWQSVNHNEKIGCKAISSIVNNAKGELFYYATDQTFREIDGGEISYAIGPVASNVNPSVTGMEKMKSLFVAEYSEVWWSIAHSTPGEGEAVENNKIVKFSSEGEWTEKNIGVTAFGSYNRFTNWTIDTIPFDTIDGIGWKTIDSVESAAGFAVDICGDLDGNTWTCHTSNSDKDQSFTASFTLSTDLAGKQALNWRKRLLSLQIFIKKQTSGVFKIEIASDTGPFFTVGEVELTGSTDTLIIDLPNENPGTEVDIVGNHFLVRFSSESEFKFVGVVFGFVPAGEHYA